MLSVLADIAPSVDDARTLLDSPVETTFFLVIGLLAVLAVAAVVVAVVLIRRAKRK